MNEIDWTLVARIVVPLIAVILAFSLGKYFQDRPRLLTYFGHTSAHRIAPSDDIPQGGTLHTHSVVIRNAGRKAATNVRVSHRLLPLSYNVFPDMAYSVEQLPDGGTEIVFPKLIPKEQITISYLYLPPLTFDQVHFGIRSDEGFARPLPVLPTPQPAMWVALVFWTLTAIGALTVCYVLAQVFRSSF